jgi:hypothetical protein
VRTTTGTRGRDDRVLDLLTTAVAARGAEAGAPDVEASAATVELSFAAHGSRCAAHRALELEPEAGGAAHPAPADVDPPEPVSDPAFVECEQVRQKPAPDERLTLGAREPLERRRSTVLRREAAGKRTSVAPVHRVEEADHRRGGLARAAAAGQVQRIAHHDDPRLRLGADADRRDRDRPGEGRRLWASRIACSGA